MVTCPNCNNKIPNKKLIFFGTFSKIKCPNCKKSLIGNERRNFFLRLIYSPAIILPLLYISYKISTDNFEFKHVLPLALSAIISIFISCNFTRLDMDPYEYL